MEDQRTHLGDDLAEPDVPRTEFAEPMDDFDPEDLAPRAFKLPSRGRMIAAAGVLLALLLLAVLPPLISMNRFRKQIARSISASLGRPVHMDTVTLNLLPLPGFTLENFVVGEDPEFGSEPVIHANSVRATLRWRSLWRRRVEFSRISLEDTSVNLVHLPDGRWNIESILLQASKIAAAPTAQAKAGDAPRFPYIEATGARVNVKMGLEKMPWSLTETEFALWLPEPEQWRVRLEGHPTRTDTAATDTGTVRLQGAFGKAATIRAVPLDVALDWRNAPLGGVSWVLLGRDAGLRGEMNVTTSVRGTVGENAVTAELKLAQARRADFVPERMLDANITCTAQASAVFHTFKTLLCAWPTGETIDGAPAGLTIAGDVPDVTQPGTAKVTATLRGVPVSGLLDTVRVASNRVAPQLQAKGSITGAVECCALASVDGLKIAGAGLTLGDAKPFVAGDLTAALKAQEWTSTIPLDLGASVPATLELNADAKGYRLHLTGSAMRSRMLLLAQALPQFGDGLSEALPFAVDRIAGEVETPMRVDLLSTRVWGGGQTWAEAVAKPVSGRKGSRRR